MRYFDTVETVEFYARPQEASVIALIRLLGKLNLTLTYEDAWKCRHFLYKLKFGSRPKYAIK